MRVEQALQEHPHLVVLGDPGSGKTTLLRYLALLYARDLAQGVQQVTERLGLSETGRLPVLLPLRQIGAFLRTRRPDPDGTEGCGLLLEFLLEYLKNERVPLPADFFDSYLKEGQAVLLLDGMDEVADPALRGRVARLVESFTLNYPTCRFVVTSRIVGYTGPARLSGDYSAATVRDFTLADVQQFLTHWHRLIAVGQMGPGESAEHYAANQTAQLMQAIQENERIRELAINPLLLTVLALVHRDRVKLPDRRAELYAEAVDVLLGKWDEARGVKEITILDERPFDTGDRRLLRQTVALHMHERQQKEIAAEELRKLLSERFAEILGAGKGVRQTVERFQRVIEERTGLLAARGEGVYAFSHLTFQEYLAALAVAGRDDYVDYTLKNCGEAWWREVILLEAGFLSTQSKERTTRLVRTIAEKKQEPALYHNLVLAADCLRDVGGSRVEGGLESLVQQRLRSGLETPPPLLARWRRGEGVRDWIEHRSAATQALAQCGVGYWQPPYGEPEWVTVPAGEFWMGGKGEYDGKPLHQVMVAEFQIARVPVTNAQYALFVKASKHEAPKHFEEGRPPKGKDSHPVVYVSWHVAQAYCQWLSKQLRREARLPTEAEWEKAARGDKDQRAYPWGENFEATRCNTGELNLGGTTPVGIFLEGASPYGCLDMSGSVWEWTSTQYVDYPYKADDGRENPKGGAARVLRGGAFSGHRRSARCAYRNFGGPDSRYSYIGFRVVCSPSSRS